MADPCTSSSLSLLEGGRRGQVASLSSSHEDNDVGQREGRGITTTIAGGEFASSLLLRCMGKDFGERVKCNKI